MLMTSKALRVTLVLTALLILAACTAGGSAYDTENDPSAGSNPAEDSGLPEIYLGDIDLNDTLIPLYMTMEGFNLDFFNVDFTEYDILDPEKSEIIQFAKYYIPTDYDVEGMEFMRFSDLKLFMWEAYGIDLPAESIGRYEYDSDNDTISYMGSDAGFNTSVFKISELTAGEDNTIIANTDLYLLDLESWDNVANLEEEIRKPVSEWDAGMVYSKTASPVITFKINEDCVFFPIRLVKIESA